MIAFVAGCACAIVAASIGFQFGRVAGYAKGSADGWQDGYFRRIADDRAKRDNIGRFRAPEIDARRRDWRSL